MSMTTAAEIAKGLSTEEWAALEYVQTNGSYPINDEDKSLTNFDRVFLKGLLNKIYNQGIPRYFLNVYGNAILEARASAPVAGKPAAVTAKEFVEQRYAEKIAKGECVVKDEYLFCLIEPLSDCKPEVSGNYIFKTQARMNDTGWWESEINPSEKLSIVWLTPPHPASPQPAAEAADSGADEPQTQAELCEREIVKIRSLTLKDDEYTGGLLADAVGSPVGITMCVEARMKQIADLQSEIERLKKQIKKLKHKSNLDDGFIDYLTQESEE